MKKRNILSQKQIISKIKKLEKENPDLLKAMKNFDLTFSSYEEMLRSLEPIKTVTSNSTKAY